MLASRIDDGAIPTDQAPTEQERAALAHRLGSLKGAMVGASKDEIEALITALLAGYPSGRGHRDEPEKVLRSFRQALAGIPAWAIAAACSAWNRGEVEGKNSSFAPSPADLRDAALSESRHFRTEQQQIERILNAETVHMPSDEERERVNAGFKALLERIGKGSEDEDRAAKERVAASMRETSQRALVRELERAGINDGRMMSLELRQQIAVMQARREQQDMDGTAEAAAAGPDAYQEHQAEKQP